MPVTGSTHALRREQATNRSPHPRAHFISKGKTNMPKRMTFEFSDAAIERLDGLKMRSDARSYSDVVRQALKVYAWMATQGDEGFEVYLKNKKGDLIKAPIFFEA